MTDGKETIQVSAASVGAMEGLKHLLAFRVRGDRKFLHGLARLAGNDQFLVGYLGHLLPV
jgi:hypothetical protein